DAEAGAPERDLHGQGGGIAESEAGDHEDLSIDPGGRPIATVREGLLEVEHFTCEATLGRGSGHPTRQRLEPARQPARGPVQIREVGIAPIAHPHAPPAWTRFCTCEAHYIHGR